MQRFLTSSAVALIAGAVPALAEVTPGQVWTNLASYYSDMGYDIAIGSRDEAGQNLTLNDVTITTEADYGKTVITVPKINLTQTGDARVRTEFDGDILLTSEATGEDAEDLPAFDIVISMPGNEMVSSGEPDDMLHEVTYPTLKMALDLGDEIVTDAEAPFLITVNDVTGTYRAVEDAGRLLTYDFKAAGLDLAVSMNEPEGEDGQPGEGKIIANAKVDGLSSTGSMTIPEGDFNMAERPDQALEAGMKADGTFAMGGIEGTANYSGTNAEGAAESGDVTYTAGKSDLVFSMSGDGLTYEVGAEGSQMEIASSDLPFPVGYAIESAKGALTFPISAADAPQPFTLSYALEGLTLADAIWNLFDPQEQLPRDPANLTLDLSGTALVRQSLFDPSFGQQMQDYAEQMETAEPGTEIAPPPSPFQPKALTINKLSLQAVGVDAQVTGDLTLPETEGQMPFGTVEGSFTGVNGLLDKLVSMGLLPQEQVMGARMMIAMFARPAEDNPEQLNTTLELREDGSIFANGQQVK